METATDSGQLVMGTYLLLPQTLPVQKFKGSVYSFGSIDFSSASWSRMDFASGHHGPQYLNLIVVDWPHKRHYMAFDRQVALGGWSLSFDRKGDLHFGDRLILVARAADADSDGKIDWDDPVQGFVLELSTGRRTQLSPDGYSVENVHVPTQAGPTIFGGPASGENVLLTKDDVDYGSLLPCLLMTLRAVDDDSVALYRCNPYTLEGELVVTELPK